jgi:hypothetical protein
MTIGEHLRFRALTALGFGVVAILLGYIACFFIESSHPGFNTHPRLSAPLLGVLVAVIASGGGFDRCPRCGTNLDKFKNAQFGTKDRRPVWQVFDKCPNCGVSFDAPYEG